jgi:hypothetical protein
LRVLALVVSGRARVHARGCEAGQRARRSFGNCFTDATMQPYLLLRNGCSVIVMIPDDGIAIIPVRVDVAVSEAVHTSILDLER